MRRPAHRNWIAVAGLLTVAATGGAWAPDRVIVELAGEPGMDATQLVRMVGASRAEPLVRPGGVLSADPVLGGSVILFVPPGTDPLTVVESLAKTPGVVRADVDHLGWGADVFPDDPLFDDQWSLHDAEDTDIDGPQGWEITTGGPVLVAVLDTGAQSDHPLLQGVLVPGWDEVNDDDDPEDDHGHGTAVTTVLASRGGDGQGMAGVCWQCRILPVKVLDENNEGYYSDWIRAIDGAVTAGARVINMSLGGTSDDAGLEAAVSAARDHGVVVVAAMMNQGDDVPFYPAAFESTIAVGATDRQARRASLLTTAGWASSFGPHQDLCAPGVQIVAGDLGSSTAWWSGTSLAVPMVSGAVALLFTVDPELSPGEVRSLLRSTARDQEGRDTEDLPGWDPYHGAGRLDLDDLLRAAAPLTADEVEPLAEVPDGSSGADDTGGAVTSGQGCGCDLVS